MDIWIFEKISESVVSAIVAMGLETLVNSTNPMWREIGTRLQGKGKLSAKTLEEIMKKDPHFAEEIINFAREIELIEKPIPLTLNLQDWVGRKDAIQQLKTWLNTPSVTTIGIQGLGGVGKSYLVTYFYQEYQQSTNNFHPIYFDFNCRKSKKFIDFAEEITRIDDNSQVVSELISYLNQSRILLVIDNLENLLDESRNFQDQSYEQFFKYWIQSGRSSVILLTTREKPVILAGQRYWYSLEGLKLQESIDLLTSKLRIEGNSSELQDIVRYVDGHPLALRLVANYLQRNCDSNLNNIKNLSLAKFSLVYQQAEGIYGDQNSTNLEKIIKQHFTSLTERQKDFLFKLSVYRQPFDCQAALYMWTKEEENVEPQLIDIQKELRELSDRSLLMQIRDRYKNQPLVQRYILQKAEDLASAHQSAISYFRKRRQSKPWQTIEDVHAYLETFYHQFQLKEYDNAFDSIKVVNDFLTQCSYYGVQVEYYSQLVAAYETTGDTKKWNYAACCAFLGDAYFNLEQYEQGIEYHARAVDSSRNTDYSIPIVEKLSQLYKQSKQNPFRFYQRILKIGKSVNDRKKNIIYELCLGSNIASVMKFIQKNKLLLILFLSIAVVVSPVVSPFALAWIIWLVLRG